jgi:hypothetical protein
MMPSEEQDGKYQHRFLVHSEPDVGLPTHEDVYDFVGRVFLDVVDLTQWKMELIFHTAMKEESNVRQYKWDYQSLPVGRRSRVHRPVRDRDDSADDEDLSEAAVTFAREQVEMKETPKPQYGEVDTFEGTWISVEFYSWIQHWKVRYLSWEITNFTKVALQGLPGGIKVAFGVPSSETDEEGQQFHVTESGDTETNVPEPLGAEIAQAHGHGTASDPRASCSINTWLYAKACPWETIQPLEGFQDYYGDATHFCRVYVNFALVNAEQARGLVDSLWVKPLELWIEHNLANPFRRNEAEEDAPSAEMPGDEKRRLAFRVFGRRKIPAEIEEVNIGDDIAAVIAGDAVNVADDDSRYLEFPQYVHFLKDVGVHFIDDDVFARGDSDATDEASGFRLPPKLFHTRCTHLPRQLRDKLIDRALKGALKDLKRQDRYGFISEEERGRLKVCDSVLAAAAGILESAGPDRAPEFFAQIQHAVDEQPDLDWKKAFRQKLRAIAFE